jgi:hypothetical protein
MAFLDNSGDIILDAVLTDTGRKRMAAGNFSIVKFALGDDEIDYGLYNKTHPSGSAYYDLEILQTPILEAFTQANASINYGLVTYTRNDLLYLPTIKHNELSSFNDEIASKASTGNIIYLASGKANTTGTSTANLLTADGLQPFNIMDGSTSGGKKRFIFIETGLDTAELAGDRSQQNSYLIAMGLVDAFFNVSYDSRFISAVYGPLSGFSFTSTKTEGKLDGGTNNVGTAGSAGGTMANYVSTAVNGVLNGFYSGGDFTGTIADYSVIAGPRGAMTALAFSIKDVPLNDFSKYGNTGNAVFGSSNTYDYIDTMIYITGQSTGITMHIPIRIIQAAQSS